MYKCLSIHGVATFLKIAAYTENRVNHEVH
jgi:hypothetical protein